MSKAMVGIAAAVVVALVGAAGIAGSAAVNGAQIRTRMEAAASQLPSSIPTGRLLQHTYRKGLFSSTQELTLGLGCPRDSHNKSDATAQVTVRHRIQHGPLPGFKTAAAAVIDSELVLDPVLAKRLEAYIGQQPPIGARTVVAFDGGYRMHVAVPSFNMQEARNRLEWQGLEADISADGWGPGHRVIYSVNMPGLAFSGQDARSKGEIQWRGLAMRGEVRVGDVWWASAGKGSAEIASLSVVVDAPGPQGRSQPVRFALRDAKFSSESARDGDLMSAASRMSAVGQVQDAVLETLDMQASIKRLHVPTYLRAIKSVADGMGACGAPVDPGALMARLRQDLLALLPYGPVYSLDRLAVQVGGKRAEVSYQASVEGVTESDITGNADPITLATKVKVKGELKVPVSWIGSTMAYFQGGRGANDVAAQAELAHVMLEQGASQGLLIREGEFIRSGFALDKGQLTVNGKALSALR